MLLMTFVVVTNANIITKHWDDSNCDNTPAQVSVIKTNHCLLDMSSGKGTIHRCDSGYGSIMNNKDVYTNSTCTILASSTLEWLYSDSCAIYYSPKFGRIAFCGDFINDTTLVAYNYLNNDCSGQWQTAHYHQVAFCRVYPTDSQYRAKYMCYNDGTSSYLVSYGADCTAPLDIAKSRLNIDHTCQVDGSTSTKYVCGANAPLAPTPAPTPTATPTATPTPVKNDTSVAEASGAPLWKPSIVLILVYFVLVLVLL